MQRKQNEKKKSLFELEILFSGSFYNFYVVFVTKEGKEMIPKDLVPSVMSTLLYNVDFNENGRISYSLFTTICHI
jgi:hypothetical protein